MKKLVRKLLAHSKVKETFICDRCPKTIVVRNELGGRLQFIGSDLCCVTCRILHHANPKMRKSYLKGRSKLMSNIRKRDAVRQKAENERLVQKLAELEE